MPGPLCLQELDNGCGCVELKLVTVVIAYLSLLFVVPFVYALLIAVKMDVPKKPVWKNINSVMLKAYGDVVITGVLFASSVMLVWGIHAKKPRLMLLWLWYIGLTLIQWAVAAPFYSMMLTSNVLVAFIGFFVMILILLLLYYCFLIVYSYYRVLVELNEREMNMYLND